MSNPSPRSMRRVSVMLALCAWPAGCSDDAPHRSQARAQAPAPGAAPEATRTDRSLDADVVRLRQLIDLGHLDAARALLATVRARTDLALGVEDELLAARLDALAGRDLEAGRRIERARELSPTDARVFATAAELHGARGRFETAWDELRRGEQACGAGRPEFLRARGVLWLARQNGARSGVSALEEALGLDPTLPYVDRALGQGYLLIAKQELAGGDPAAARAALERSLAHDPADVDARRVLAEALSASGDQPAAARVLAELVADGEPLEAELALTWKHAGFAWLIVRERDKALDAFVAARAAGLADLELGSALQLLDDAAAEAVDAGLRALEQADDAAALRSFQRALELDPGRLDATHHLGVAALRSGDLEQAIDAWRRVLELAAEEGIELPDPVHVNLAQALLQRGERAQARVPLEDYLARRPGGAYADATRELLAELSE